MSTIGRHIMIDIMTYFNSWAGTGRGESAGFHTRGVGNWDPPKNLRIINREFFLLGKGCSHSLIYAHIYVVQAKNPGVNALISLL